MAWTGAPPDVLERASIPFQTVEQVLGPDGVVAAEAAARTFARVWGRLPLVDGKSFRELVTWRGASLLWSAEGFLREETAGPRCARTAERALRLLEATGATEVDAPGVSPEDALLLARACSARGVLFHGKPPGAGRPLPVGGASRGPGPLRRALAGILAASRPPPPPPVSAGEAATTDPILVLAAGGEEHRALAPLLPEIADQLGRGALVVTLREIARWETRRALRAVGEAKEQLRGCAGRLAGSPGLAESYAHRGVRFADLAAADLEALLGSRLPTAVRLIESTLELLAASRPAAVLVFVPGADVRRSLVHACSAAGTPAVALLRGGTAGDDAFRADGGPQPSAVQEWGRGEDPGSVVARLREATRGRVEPR